METHAAEVFSETEEKATEKTSLLSEIVFLGTGCSSGIPLVSCLQSSRGSDCACRKAALMPASRNRRRTISSIFRVGKKNIMFDCGKYWWQAAVDVIPTLDPPLVHLDAVVLSHEHADATLGLDCLRDLTKSRKKPLPIYLDAASMERVRGVFPYLVSVDSASGSGFVSLLSFHVFEPEKTFTIGDDEDAVEIFPFQVDHGPNCYCNAFRIGDIIWMSDVAHIPSNTRRYLKDAELVVLDCLRKEPTPHISHFGLEQALEEISSGFHKGVRPKKVLLVGMNCSLEHDSTNRELRERGFEHVQLAYDGQVHRTAIRKTLPTWMMDSSDSDSGNTQGEHEKAK